MNIDTKTSYNDFLPHYPDDGQWKQPLFLAVGVHLLALVILIFPTSLFQPNLDLEEIYTVDLFEAGEAGPVEPAPAPPVKTPRAKKAEPPPQEAPVLAEAPKPVASINPIEDKPAEVVSLKPRAIKKDLRKKLAKVQERKINNALERIKDQLSRQELIEQRQLLAQQAASDAVDKLREAIHYQNRASSVTSPVQTRSSAPGGGSGRSDQMEAALKQYYIAVSQKIHEHWILPDLQDWKKDLVAVMVVHVRSDGVVTKSVFETKSNNIFFNQFVEKTLQESLPLPPFPPNLDEKNLEIGLVFHPEGLI